MKQVLKFTLIVLAASALIWSAKKVQQESANKNAQPTYLLAGKGGI